MEQAERDRLVNTYVAVIASFRLGTLRFWGAEAAASRLNLALLEYRAEQKALSSQGPTPNPVFAHLERIPYSSYDALGYVTNVSHVVYATSLLDTFLTDTTQFLFLLFPESMGKDHQVPLKTLIGAASARDVVATAAAARAREVAYLPFGGRLEFLEERFGLRLDLPAEVGEALLHYPSVRNAAVHDQGIFELLYDSDGHVVARRKTCSRHPSQIRSHDVSAAIRAYEAVFLAVAGAVVRQVLKAPEHPAVAKLLASGGEEQPAAGAPSGPTREEKRGDA
jgi:hypothetical protein